MNNPKFKILPHAADVKIKVFGNTKQELFLNAVEGMNAILKSRGKGKSVCRKIEVESLDLNALLIDFLNEILYLSETNREVYNEVKFKNFSDKRLQGELTGNEVESFGEDIKAVTYHGVEIKKKNNVYRTDILFDI